jgi:hypothetical protein
LGRQYGYYNDSDVEACYSIDSIIDGLEDYYKAFFGFF